MSAVNVTQKDYADFSGESNSVTIDTDYIMPTRAEMTGITVIIDTPFVLPGSTFLQLQVGVESNQAKFAAIDATVAGPIAIDITDVESLTAGTPFTITLVTDEGLSLSDLTDGATMVDAFVSILP